MADRSNIDHVAWQTKALWFAIAISIATILFGAGTYYGQKTEHDSVTATELSTLSGKIDALQADANRRMGTLEQSVSEMHGFLMRQFGMTKPKQDNATLEWFQGLPKAK